MRLCLGVEKKLPPPKKTDLVSHLVECVSTRASRNTNLAFPQVREMVEKRILRSRVDSLRVSNVDRKGNPSFIDTFFLTYVVGLTAFACPKSSSRLHGIMHQVSCTNVHLYRGHRRKGMHIINRILMNIPMRLGTRCCFNRYRMFMTPDKLFQMLSASIGSATTRFPVLATLVHWATYCWIDFEDNEELYDHLLALTKSLTSKLSAQQSNPLDTPSLKSITKASARCEHMRTELVLTIQTQNKLFLFDRSKPSFRTYGPTATVVLQLRSRCVAEQLAIFNQNILSSVEPVEYVFYYFPNSRPGGIERSPNLANAIKRFDQESYWVAAEIRLPDKVKEQASIITKFIKVADHSAKLGNFFSVFSILGALCFPEVTRLKPAWEKVPDKVKRLQSQLEDIMNPSRNMKKYRERLAQFNGAACVPCLPLHLKDLVFANETKDVQTNSIVNFEKLTMVARLVATLVTLKPYIGVREDAALQAYLQVSIINPENPIITGLSQLDDGASPNARKGSASKGKRRLKEVKQMLLKSFMSDGSHISNPDDSVACPSPTQSRKLRNFFGRKEKKETAPVVSVLAANNVKPPLTLSSLGGEDDIFDTERRRKFLIQRVVSPPRHDSRAVELRSPTKLRVRSLSLTSLTIAADELEDELQKVILDKAAAAAESDDESEADEPPVAQAWCDQSIIAMDMSPRRPTVETPRNGRAALPPTPLRTPTTGAPPGQQTSTPAGTTSRMQGLNNSFKNAVQRNPPSRFTSNMASSPLKSKAVTARSSYKKAMSSLASKPEQICTKQDGPNKPQVDMDAAIFSHALKQSALR